MILEKIGYSYNDLTIIPSDTSVINSRSECSPTYNNGKLPLFASCMSTVVSPENYEIWEKNGITPIIPRNVPIDVRLSIMELGRWVAVSLTEFRELFINSRGRSIHIHYHICIDIANGHMKSLYADCIEAKNLSNELGYKLSIMTGNIANPETYEWICRNIHCKDKNGKEKTAVDYIRVGIGTGLGCFIDGTKIITKDGLKNIEDINNEDYVLTIDGSYQKVISTLRYKDHKLIKINNEITSTENHKYFVINKSDKDKITEDNLQKYGYWIEANKLNPSIHLLVKKYK